MLHGKRIYIVEDEAIVAMEMQQLLEERGAEVRTFQHAGEIRDADLSTIDLVLFDARMGAASVVDFASRLRTADVAMVVASADSGVGSLFPDAVPLAKPFLAETLIDACQRAISA